MLPAVMYRCRYIGVGVGTVSHKNTHSVFGGAWEVVNCHTRESHGPLHHSRMTERRYGRCVFSEHE